MPMHDWTRAWAADWHNMHLGWVVYLTDRLNQFLLPPDHSYSLMEFNEAPLDSTRKFDIPKIDFDPWDEEQLYIRRRQTIALRRVRDHGKFGLIEITSPGLKQNATAFAAFVGKMVTAIRRGFTVLLIDPFPPTDRVPHHLHSAIWKELTGKPFAPEDSKPLTVASYPPPGSERFRGYLEPLAVGDHLPDMPLFLSGEEYVTTPLEETYAAAWKGYPAFLRKMVEGP